MRTLIIILTAILLAGCSNQAAPTVPDPQPGRIESSGSNNLWPWGIWQFRFSEDHARVEAVPVRAADFHYNVTRFMEEGPCFDCLKIGKPDVQEDGTVKLNVTLKHPFPNQSKYTGFDVRGMVYLPSTQEHSSNLWYYSLIYNETTSWYNPFLGTEWHNTMPLVFSTAADGGGELLNNDGYSCYLIPGVTYSEDYPIYSYQPGIQGSEPTPFSTIIPYKLFASDTERRMFLVDDEITREYHFALPPGEFNFGYAVDASWWAASNLPVTDPATDFPPEANSEDPWLIEYEQLLPINEENVDKNVFEVIVHHRELENNWRFMIFSWGISYAPYEPEHYPKFYGTVIEELDEFTTRIYGGYNSLMWYYFGKDGNAIPGNHLGVLVVAYEHDGYLEDKRESRFIYGVKLIEFYIEG